MNPKAYRGTEPYIFISYAHKNEQVLSLIGQLQSHGYRVWYDEGIEAGNEWADRIAAHLEPASAMIAFLTKEYLASDNCLDEIEYAKNHKIPTIVVYLEDVEVPQWFDLRHSRVQAIFCSQYGTGEAFFERLKEAQILFPSREDRECAEPPKQPEKPMAMEANIDRELREHFARMFGDGEEKPTEPQVRKESPLNKLLQKKLGAYLVEHMNDPEGPVDLEESEPSKDAEETDGSKVFSFTEAPGAKTLVYKVVNFYDTRKNTVEYQAVFLESEWTEQDDGVTVNTVSVDRLSKGGNALIFVTSLPDCISVNLGSIDHKIVKISRNPSITPHTRRPPTDQQLSGAVYDLNHAPNGGLIAYDPDKHQQLFAAEMDSKVIIVDPETWTPVLRQVRKNEKTGELEAQIPLNPHKKYFAFEVRRSDGPSARPLTELELGKFYRSGLHGYPRDVLKAAEHLEADGSAEAFYEISRIFAEEPEFMDADAAQTYLEKARELGWEDGKKQGSSR